MRKTILITGASCEIGQNIALEFAKNNYNVIISYNTNKTEACKLGQTINKLYDVDTLLIEADITKEDDVIRLVNNSIKRFGSIDVLINNAAYCRDNNYLSKTKDEFLRVLEVNVIGTFLVTKYSLKYMNNGIVVNISSRDAVDTYNDLSMDYCASKAGVNSLTKTFALGCSNNKFVAIMFPWINTDSTREMYPEFLKEEMRRTKQLRLIEPIEVANIVKVIVDDKNIKSGDIKAVDIDNGGKLCIKNLVYQMK